MSIDFRKVDDNKDPAGAGKLLLEFWSYLQQQENRGARARLRRCRQPGQVMLEDEAVRFLCKMHAWLPAGAAQETQQMQLATIVGLLAHVEKSGDTRVAASLAKQKNGRPTLSSLRFRRLLQRERDELYEEMVRVMRMLDKQANIVDLAQSVFYWGDKVRRDWANQYFPLVSDKA